jgi:hypothetical protein
MMLLTTCLKTLLLQVRANSGQHLYLIFKNRS